MYNREIKIQDESIKNGNCPLKKIKNKYANKQTLSSFTEISIRHNTLLKTLLKLLENISEGCVRNSRCHILLNYVKYMGEQNKSVAILRICMWLCLLMVDPNAAYHQEFLFLLDSVWHNHKHHFYLLLLVRSLDSILHGWWFCMLSPICMKTWCVTPLHLTQCVTAIHQRTTLLRHWLLQRPSIRIHASMFLSPVIFFFKYCSIYRTFYTHLVYFITCADHT